MHLRVALFVHLLCWSGGVQLAWAQAPDTVTIDVDATDPGSELRRVWSYYGYDEANVTTTPEGRQLLGTLAAINSAPTYVRTHFLFNTGDGTPTLKWGSTNIYSEDDGGSPIYDYTLLDEIMDATVDAGTLPLVELGFMPRDLSTQPDPYENSNTYALDGGSFYPPQDYDKWAALVAAWATHVVERYPEAASTWQWELWNEPDIGYWNGTFEEYAQLYDYTEAALHEVIPNASLGGPAVARPEGAFLSQFLEHCANGTNYVSGRQGTRLDMVSFHAKGGVTIADGHVQLDLGNQLRLHRAGFDAIAASAFAQKPVVISEADPDGCAACPISTAPHHAYRNSAAYGAYEVATMKRTLDLAAEAGVDLRGVLTWAFTFPDSPYFAGYRTLSTNGIHLPVLNAFKLLGRLNGNRLPVTSSGALATADIVNEGVRDDADIDALAAVGNDEIQVLVWNYHDNITDAPSTPVTLQLAMPTRFKSGVTMTHTRVDESNGNAFAVWDAQGRPESPSGSQRTELEAAMSPVVLEVDRVAPDANGTVAHSFELPRFGMSLFTFTLSNDSDPTASPAEHADGSCSCRLSPPARLPPPALVAFSLAIALAFRGRFCWRARCCSASTVRPRS